MTEERKAPSIRFKEFSGDVWKKRKLEEVADRFDNLRIPVSANKRKSGSIPYYGANGIQDYVDGYTHDGEYILIAEEGANDLKDYPIKYVNGKVWVNNHAHVVQGRSKMVDTKFLAFAMKQINIKPYLVGGGRAKLNADIMMKLPLKFPTLPEQRAIGSFFQELDQLIILQQHKLEKSRRIKMAMLQKMFPENEQTVPAIRFKEFSGQNAEAWEQRKLGEVVEVNSGKDYKHLSTGTIPVYGTGGYMLSVSESLSDVDGIGIGRKGTIDKPYILKAPFWTVDTLFYCIPKDANNLYFVYSVFNNVTWKNLDESTGVPSLSKITINNIQSFFPTPPEQRAIGSFFQELDQLITLQQRRLDKLKNMKKALLEQMMM